MSAICGYVGRGESAALEKMLAAVDYRGDRSDWASAEGAGLGIRYWHGRPGKTAGVLRSAAGLAAVSGSLAPPVSSPAEALPVILADAAKLSTLDGNFAGAFWDAAASRMTLVRDPFGVRALYYVERGGAIYFASELKQLLALQSLAAEPDVVALHKYLTFSFVPGEDVPIKGVKRLLPGSIAEIAGGKISTRSYFALKEEIDPELSTQDGAVRAVRSEFRDAVNRRLNGEKEVGLFLSGGIDSSGVGYWLKEAGVGVRAFTLDFGARSAEREPATEVAAALGLPLTYVPVSGADIAPILMDFVHKMDLPFGDPVTGPLFLLGRAARAAGLSCVFNGEGGDQLFGGWTSKPMIAAGLYSGLYGGESREELYLKSYHRFYGLEDELYTPEFAAAVGPPGQRRAVLAPYLHSDAAASYLNRIRLADISLKGSQNILPRMDRAAQCSGLDVRAPLFDRRFAELSFRIPPQLKLHGATEKYVLKLSLQKRLPADIVWRRKYGMGPPVTDWVMAEPLRGILQELLGERSLKRRGYFRTQYVADLLRGINLPDELRRRRVGERLWTLAMMEAWLRVFIDGRGRAPQGGGVS